MADDGISWGGRKARVRARRAVVVGLVVLLTAALTSSVASATTAPSEHVIVRLTPGASVDPQQLVASIGGTLDQNLPVIGGFSAYIPADRLADLQAMTVVAQASPDAQLVIADPDPVATNAQDAPGFVAGDFGRKGGGISFPRVDVAAIKRIIAADDLASHGITGAGVDVALIDTGVSPVPGVGQVVNGADVSFDSQVPGARYLDGYGHGTHLSGIINGSGSGVDGIAPGARIVNVKAGAANGTADVSQVIAAIDWVVQHRNDNGMNIRVLELAFGTDSTQPYASDPLAYAVEVAWRKGIVVVAAAGNRGASAGTLDDPASDPRVIAVGASQSNGTYTTADDEVAPFSSVGSTSRGVDVVAPGRSVVSLRVPGSYIDTVHPEGREPDGLFRGSGTSQASAVVAGTAALLLQAQPDLTPDQVKWLLKRTGQRLPFADTAAQGSGIIDARKAATRAAPTTDTAAQPAALASGTGSLEAARGTHHVVMGGVELAGEQDIFGTPWDGVSWSGVSWSGVSWSGGSWMGVSWSGVSWSGVSWSGVSWSGVSWSGVSWSGVSWSGVSWSGASWDGVSWSGVSWSGVSWSGVSWSTAS